LISAHSTATFSSPPAGVGTELSARDPVKRGEFTLSECEEGKDQVGGDFSYTTVC